MQTYFIVKIHELDIPDEVIIKRGLCGRFRWYIVNEKVRESCVPYNNERFVFVEFDGGIIVHFSQANYFVSDKKRSTFCVDLETRIYTTLFDKNRAVFYNTLYGEKFSDFSNFLNFSDFYNFNDTLRIVMGDREIGLTFVYTDRKNNAIDLRFHIKKDFSIQAWYANDVKYEGNIIENAIFHNSESDKVFYMDSVLDLFFDIYNVKKI